MGDNEVNPKVRKPQILPGEQLNYREMAISLWRRLLDMCWIIGIFHIEVLYECLNEND